MSEPTTPTAEPTSPRTIDDLVSAAQATLAAAEEGGEAKTEDEAPEPAQADADPASDEQADGEADEDKSEDEAEPPALGKGSRIPTRAELIARKTELRRREKELAARSEELAALKAKGDSLMAAIRARDEQTKAVAQLVELARSDPDRAFAMLAERAGLSDAQLYERVTRQRLRDPNQREVAPEVAELREELRALRDEQRRREETSSAEQQRSAMAVALEQDVAKVTALADYPDRWPLASEWPTERLQAEARRLVREAYEKNAPTDVKSLADRLERIAVYEEETRAKVREARSKSPGSAPSGSDGRGLPGAQPAPKPAGSRRVVVSNTDNATTAARKQGSSFDERFALAVEEALAAQH